MPGVVTGGLVEQLPATGGAVEGQRVLALVDVSAGDVEDGVRLVTATLEHQGAVSGSGNAVGP